MQTELRRLFQWLKSRGVTGPISAPVLKKPFELEQLGAALTQLLHKSASAKLTEGLWSPTLK